MKTVSPVAPLARIVMFGIDCHFTNVVRDELSRRGLAPVALLLAGHPGIDQPIPARHPTRPLPLAGRPVQPASGLPTYRIGNLSAHPTIDLLASLRPDFITVACFPRAIPIEITRIAKVAALNVHPSLLPMHRGPDPLFWIMRDGGTGNGVTIHELANRFDAGRILAQQAVAYPAGARESEVEAILAHTGAELLAGVVRTATSGTLQTTEQEERLATYESWPRDEDYSISAKQPVLHAWNFIRGVAERGVPIRIDVSEHSKHVIDAREFGHGSAPDDPAPDEAIIAFADGWLRAVVAR